MAKRLVLVSACLTGVNCVYDGANNFHPVFAQLHRRNKAIIFCPEVLGGLKVPHSPHEIVDGDGFDVLQGKARALSCEGEDSTDKFLEGAKQTLALAGKHGIKKAIMKQKSPSCGCGWIFDGTFSGKLVPGTGVTTALLEENGIEVISDEEYLKKAEARE